MKILFYIGLCFIFFFSLVQMSILYAAFFNPVLFRSPLYLGRPHGPANTQEPHGGRGHLRQVWERPGRYGVRRPLPAAQTGSQDGQVAHPVAAQGGIKTYQTTAATGWGAASRQFCTGQHCQLVTPLLFSIGFDPPPPPPLIK
jgi:hypothetical protein